jgi:predicted HD superfamily hydrolase involved in NAD metabolism
MNDNEIRALLEQSLKRKRFEHSLGVCDEAVKMARLFGADEKKAYTAGLLHDCAKCLTHDEENELMARYKFEPDEMTKKCHPVLHAPLGALVAKHIYKVEDEEILDAIRYHTVARRGMTLLDKIVYVADMTEPNRDFDGVSELRQLAAKDIDKAFKAAIRQGLIHNIKKETFIHPGTLEAWNEICEQHNKPKGAE